MSSRHPYYILIGMVLGSILGILCHVGAPDAPWLNGAIRYVAQPVGQIFLRMILMCVIPLIFSALVLGVFELKSFGSLGRVGLKTLVYTIVASTASVFIGIFLVTVLRPGGEFDQTALQKLGIAADTSSKVIQQAQATGSLADILVALIPKNPLQAAVNAFDGDMVAFMIFTLIFGAALLLVRGHKENDPFVGALETVRDVSMQIVSFAMRLAPYGVFALMFALTAKFGWGLLLSLGKYAGVVVLGLLIQQFVVYGALLKFYGRVSPLAFIGSIKEVIITAFSTASSNATLPTSIRVAEEKLKIDRSIGTFVLTVGSTANQNGTALFEGVTILFLAQVFGIDLTFGQQVTVVLMSVVAGIGTAGVPGGSIPLIIIVMQSVGIPAEGIGIILGVDRLLDMCRTVLNVTGDIVCAYLVDISEKRARV